MSDYFEKIDLAIRPRTMEALEPVIRAAAEAEWEDDAARTEMMNLANDFVSRLQRISKGDLQPRES